MEKKLNTFLANAVAESHKLQAYHWFVKGPHFFAVHAALEKLYAQMSLTIDEVAELALQIGGEPTTSVKDMIKEASIKEYGGGFIDPENIFEDTIKDYELLFEQAVEIKTTAEEKDNPLVSAVMDDHIIELGKALWMMRQTMK